MEETIFDGKKNPLLMLFDFFDNTNENVQRCSSDGINGISKKKFLTGMVEFKNGNFTA